MAKAKATTKKTKKEKRDAIQLDLPDIKSTVLLKDRKFTRVVFGEDCLASVPIRWVIEELYEKTSKRASYENFFKKWRPTILKMDGAKLSDIEKAVLGE